MQMQGRRSNVQVATKEGTALKDCGRDADREAAGWRRRCCVGGKAGEERAESVRGTCFDEAETLSRELLSMQALSMTRSEATKLGECR
jgi:hypothetical protein